MFSRLVSRRHQSSSNQISDCAAAPDYDRSAVIKAALRAPHRPTDFVKYTSDSIELILAGIRKLTPDNDNISYWVYRGWAHELPEEVTLLVIMSGLDVVRSAWRSAVITPVPKCTPIGGVNDLSPISVTPICHAWCSD